MDTIIYDHALAEVKEHQSALAELEKLKSIPWASYHTEGIDQLIKSHTRHLISAPRAVKEASA